MLAVPVLPRGIRDLRQERNKRIGGKVQGGRASRPFCRAGSPNPANALEVFRDFKCRNTQLTKRVYSESA